MGNVDACPDLVLARNRLERGDKALGQRRLGGLAFFLLVVFSQAKGPLRVGIDDRDIFRLQLIDGAGDEPGYGNDSVLGEGAVAKLQNHRRLGSAVLVLKHRVGRHHNVDSRTLHVLERLDGLLQLSFHSPLVVDLLVELSLSPGHLVKQLEPHPSAVRSPLRRRLQPGRIQFVRRHIDGLPIGALLVRNPLRIQLRGQRLGVRRIHAGVEWLEVFSPHDAGKHRDHERGCRGTRQKESLLT